jgi:hypothetical protein
MKRLMMCLTLACGVAVWAGEADRTKVPHDRLAAPVLVLDGKEPIDVDVGHATPYVVDWDGDGKKDLLVGQFGDGKLRIYLNKGTDAQPKFDRFTYLQAGGKAASIPVS